MSTVGQNPERQLDMLKTYGVDRSFQKKTTGTRRDCPEPEHMLVHVTAGDTMVIASQLCLGRSTKELIERTELLEPRGVQLVSLQEPLDANTPTGKLPFMLMLAAQFERDAIASRTRAGEGRPVQGQSSYMRAGHTPWRSSRS